MAKYYNFDLPEGERFNPSAGRVAAFAKLLPAEPFALGPVITGREAWCTWQEHQIGRDILKDARENAALPDPDYTDTEFLNCLETKDVTNINLILRDIRHRLTYFLLSEAIYDQGEFLKPIETHARLMGQLSTWMHPNNDRG
jgi:hypothetical protein